MNVEVHVAGKPGQSVAVKGELFTADGRPAPGVSLAGSVLLGPDGSAEIALGAPVPAPALWSAEKPNLYYLVCSLTSGGKTVERVEQRFGFRQIEIKDNVVLWNGVPIKCTGVCRHDFWADRGFALTEADWVEDVTMMKAANINAVRTSHYNHAQRFLELCDEKGLYILDEVPYCWIGDKVKDPAYAPYLLQRAQETLARDKNRPCVLAWSLGNENPTGADSQAVSDFVRAADPTHPTFVSCLNPNQIQGQFWADEHYPDPAAIDRAAKNPKFGANLSEHPHTFFEKEVQAYDPGVSDVWSEALIKTWDKLWKDPTILGSFIWEWQCQGVADKNADTTTDFWYGPNHLRQENNKGIVDAYRHPKAEWWIVKSVYSPVVVEARTVNPAGESCTVPLTNHYSFTDLSELTCRWTAYKGDATLQTGTRQVACAPMQSVRAEFPAPAGTTALRLDFLHGDGTSVAAFNLAVEGVPLPAAPPALASGGALTMQDSPDALLVKNARQQWTFDKHDGAFALLARGRPRRARGRPGAQPGRIPRQEQERRRQGHLPRRPAPGPGRRPARGDARSRRRGAGRRDRHGPRVGGRSGAGHAHGHLRPPARGGDPRELDPGLDGRGHGPVGGRTEIHGPGGAGADELAARRVFHRLSRRAPGRAGGRGAARRRGVPGVQARAALADAHRRPWRGGWRCCRRTGRWWAARRPGRTARPFSPAANWPPTTA